MSDIERAVEAFQQKRLGVYRADPNQVVRDVNAARSAVEDHAGRWFWELLQNADDAKATTLIVHRDDKAIYIADNGTGLKPEAVEALCGTNYSIKTEGGTIGRKGVGFKSVYNVSKCPIVLTRQGGVEFDSDKCRKWMAQQGFSYDEVPYQWIPFFVSWGEVKERFPYLEEIEDIVGRGTVVILPTNKSKPKGWSDLENWEPYCLFTFRYLREVKTPSYEVTLTKNGKFYELSRKSLGNRGWSNSTGRWKIKRVCKKVPSNILANLDSAHRKFIERDGVSFIVGCLLDEDDIPLPTQSNLPIHVFYPTNHTAPVPLFLHAEFLVKSDRTGILRLEEYEINEWIVTQLAKLIVEFAIDSYVEEYPEAYIKLIDYEEQNDYISDELIEKVVAYAKERLRLPDVDGKLRLSLQEARFVGFSCDLQTAGEILQETSISSVLVHDSLNEDEVRDILKKYGCRGISEREFITVFCDEMENERGKMRSLLPKCYLWLAKWLSEGQYWWNRKDREQVIRQAKLIPVDGKLYSAEEPEGHILTWRVDEGGTEVPDWLPLTFVDDWLRESLPDNSEIDGLLKCLGIKPIEGSVLVKALGKAIEDYWASPQGDPARFLRFIIERRLYEQDDWDERIAHCPVPVCIHGSESVEWSKASESYFGSAWGYNDLETYMMDNAKYLVRIEDLCILLDFNKQLDCQLIKLFTNVMNWIEVKRCPEVILYKKVNIYNIPRKITNRDRWVKYLWSQTEYSTRDETVDIYDIKNLNNNNEAKLYALLRMLFYNWNYYGQFTKSKYYYFYYTSYMRPIDSPWYFYIFGILKQYWLPDEQTTKRIGDLIPILPLDEMFPDKEKQPEFREWLIREFGVRSKLEELTPEEWKTILTERIPSIAKPDDPNTPSRIQGWYAALAEWAEGKNNTQGLFKNCPLFCQRGAETAYVGSDELRYIADNAELEDVFKDDLWLCNRVRKTDAKTLSEIFDVPRLSKSVSEELAEKPASHQISNDTLNRINTVLSYIYAYKISNIKNKDKIKKIKDYLRSVNFIVTQEIKVILQIKNNNIHRSVLRSVFYHEQEKIVYITDESNPTNLAEAINEVINAALGSESAHEVDFYENLIRCYPDEEAMRKKLESKGLTSVDIDRKRELFEEEEETPTPTPINIVGPENKGAEADGEHMPISTHQPGSVTITTGVEKSDRPTTPATKASERKPPVEVRSAPDGGITEEKTDTTSRISIPQSEVPPVDTQKGCTEDTKDEEPVGLVDPSTTPYRILAQPPSRRAQKGSSYSTSTQEVSQPSTPNVPRQDIERVARQLVVRALEDKGYTDIVEMSTTHPGYDIRAKSPEGKEVHIEVKGHLKTASTVLLTKIEYEEYGRQQREGYIWELWQVQNLEAGREPEITVFTDIPPESLDFQTLKIDLTRCPVKGDQ